MALPLKILLTLLGLVIATVGAAAVWITMIFDPNDYRDQIARKVAENTGRELRLEGPLSLRLFPRVAIEVNALELANAQNFGPLPMLEVEQILASVEVLPLLRERVLRLGEIRLQGVIVRLATRGDSNNWQDMQASAEQPSESAEPAEPFEPTSTSTDEGSAQPLPDFTVAAVVLKDIRLEYDVDGERTVVRLDTLETGQIRMNEPSSLLLRLQAELPQNLSAVLELQSTWLLELEGPRLVLSDTALTTTVGGPQVPGGQQTVTALGGLTYDGANGRVSVPTWSLSTGELKATIQADIELPDTGPQGTVQVRTNAFSAQQVAASLGIPLGPPGHRGQTELDLALALAPDSLRTTRLSGRLDDAALNGQLALTNFSQPRIRTQLELAQFTLEHWTPPASEKSAADDTTEPAPPVLEQPLPLDLVKDLDLDAKVQIGQFRGAGIVAQNVLWTATSRPGQPFRQDLSMQAYGGRISARNSIDAREKTPRTGLNLNLEAVGLGDLLQGTVGARWITGLTQLNLDLSSSGNTLQSLLSSANGKALYLLQDGAVNGFSIVDLLNTAAAHLQGDAQAADGTSGSSQFKQLAGEVLFGGGRASTRNLKADSELLGLQGSGGLNLETLTWDVSLLPALKDHPRIREQKYLSRLIGVNIPLKITGALTAPQFSVDAEGALKARAKQEIDRQKDKLESKAREKVEEKIEEKLGGDVETKLKEKLGDELGGSLGNLLRGARRAPSPTPLTSPAPQPSSAPGT